MSDSENTIVIWLGGPFLSKDELHAVLLVGMKRFLGREKTKNLRFEISSYCDKRIKDFESVGLFTKKYRAEISKELELTLKER